MDEIIEDSIAKVLLSGAFFRRLDTESCLKKLVLPIDSFWKPFGGHSLNVK